jgi:hypothetical protein
MVRLSSHDPIVSLSFRLATTLNCEFVPSFSKGPTKCCKTSPIDVFQLPFDLAKGRRNTTGPAIHIKQARTGLNSMWLVSFESPQNTHLPLLWLCWRWIQGSMGEPWQAWQSLIRDFTENHPDGSRAQLITSKVWERRMPSMHHEKFTKCVHW